MAASATVMKRRNTEMLKPRRTLKRFHKFAEGSDGSSLIYLKMVLIWCSVLLLDFILEFRFEYIWPFWLLLQNVCEYAKFPGMLFTILHVCFTVVLDATCFAAIPTQILFFLASSYVWVQYLWQPERGVCMPAITLWLVFVYIEASVRLKELPMNSLQVDVCHPLAAHCVGYPMVTLSSALGKYMQYRLRLWTQVAVKTENEFYFELLRNSLPKHSIQDIVDVTDAVSLHKTDAALSCLGTNSPCTKKTQRTNCNELVVIGTNSSSYPSVSESSGSKLRRRNGGHVMSSLKSTAKKAQSHPGYNFVEDTIQVYKTSSRSSSASSIENTSPKSAPSEENFIIQGVMAPSIYDKKVEHLSVNSDVSRDKFAEENNEKTSEFMRIEKLETCIAELRSEVSSMRHCEGLLRMQNFTLSNGEKSAKNELAQLRRDNEQLQSKLHNLVSIKQKDKLIVESLEKQLKNEIILREDLEKILQNERTRKKEEEETAARAVALVASNREKEKAEEHKKCVDGLEKECAELKNLLSQRMEYCKKLETEVGELKKNEKTAKETETLMSALAAMQEKNAVLEKSLSSETRLKLDLFSALGDVKRQLEIAHSIRCRREVEIQELQARVADVLSVLPDTQTGPTTPHYSTTFLENHTQPSVPLAQAQPYSTTFCPLPVTPLAQRSIDPHSIIHPNAMIQPSGIISQMPLDPGAAVYAPSSNAI